MNTRRVTPSAIAASVIVLAATAGITVSAHHSFAMYDQKKVHFVLLAPDHKSLAKGPDGKPVEWGIEMAGAAQLERQGINAKTYAVGTVISVHLNPLRDGSNFGARTGVMARCPIDPATNKVKLPEPGKHCDSVPGHTLSGGTTF
jgi:hypothetical protein